MTETKKRLMAAIERKLPKQYGKVVDMFGACKVKYDACRSQFGYPMQVFYYGDSESGLVNHSLCTENYISDIADYILGRAIAEGFK